MLLNTSKKRCNSQIWKKLELFKHLRVKKSNKHTYKAVITKETAVDMCYVIAHHLACMSSFFMSWLLGNAVSFESKIMYIRERSKSTVNPTSFLYIRILEHNGDVLFKKLKLLLLLLLSSSSNFSLLSFGWEIFT